MPTASHLTCLCGGVQEPGSLLASQSLPEEACMCHCDSCRRTTGSLGTWYLTLTGRPSEKSLANATAYSTSERYTRYFCSECGCNVFICSEADGRWSACAGIAELKEDEGKGQKNLSKITYHEWVEDAKDGGIATFLTELDAAREVPCYTTEPGESKNQTIEKSRILQLQQTALLQPKSVVAARGDFLAVSCGCGACQLHIAPPAYGDTSEGWYVPKMDRGKYYARLCCCRSCRLTLGFPLQPWTYIPPSQIFTTAKEPVIFGPKAKETVQIEKLKHYQSSEAVLRSFCTVCGATMYYQSFDRPYIIDVSVGVLVSKFGNAMAGEWLEWDRGIVSKRPEAVEEELVEAWMSK